MDTEGNEVLPPFPPSPRGRGPPQALADRRGALLYWDAVSRFAWDVGDDSLLETANGLKKSYEDAREELSKVEEPPPQKACSRFTQGPAARLAHLRTPRQRMLV